MSDHNVLFGKYKIISSLGKGGYSSVLLAKHIKLNCLRAIKVISKKNPLYDRLIEEAIVLKNLSHECIPTIYDIEEDEGCAYIIEEYCRGRSLKEEKSIIKEFQTQVVVDYALQICDLMEYLHNGGRKVLYLDLKPENIIISEGRLCLVDFGAAVHADKVNEMKYSLGTRGFAAPEQYTEGHLDARSDIYGIGKIIKYMSGDNIDGSLSRIIDRCLEKDPDKRFSSVGHLKREVEKYSSNCGLRRKISSAKKLSGIMDFRKRKKSDMRLIGVFATHSGAGATHISYMLCCYFVRNMESTLLVTFDSSKGDDNRDEIYVESKRSFDVLNVSNVEDIFEYDTSRYRRVVVDVGVINVHNSAIVDKADVRMVATSMSEWKVGELIKFVERFSMQDYTWNYFAPFVTERDQKIMKDYFGVKISQIGFEPQVDNISEKAKETMLIGLRGV